MSLEKLFDDSITLPISKSMKVEFQKNCFYLRTDMSKELRKFINRFNKRWENDRTKNTNK